MRSLAVLLLVTGLVFTITLGVTGFIVGPLTMIVGAHLILRERRRQQHYLKLGESIPRRSGGQRLLIGVTFVSAAACMLVAIVWSLARGLVETGNGFLSASAARDMATAETFLAKDFRDAGTGDNLQKLTEALGLTQYASSSWTGFSIEDTQGRLDGTLHTVNGDEFHVGFSMVKEDGQWKIDSIHIPASRMPPNYRIRTPEDTARYRARSIEP